MFGVRWFKCGYVAVDRGFSEGIAHVWIMRRSHIHPVEFHFQFVATHGKYAKFTLIVAVDTVRLRGSNDLMLLWRLRRSHRRLILGGS